MEIIIAIVVVVIGAALYYNRKPKSTETVEEAPAPYKVETPVVDQVTDAVTQEAAPAKKKPAAKKAPAKATAKKAPAKPRAKKTTTK